MRRHSVIPWWLAGAFASGGTVFGQILSVDVTSSGTPGAACYANGETVTASVTIGPYEPAIAGGQFLFRYDPSCLTFVTIEAGVTCDGTSPFDHLVFSDIDDTEGSIFAAVDTLVIGNGAIYGATLACVTFQKTAACGGCDLCFDSESPFNTYLTDIEAAQVTPMYVNGGCSAQVRGLGTVTLSSPRSTTVAARCDTGRGYVTWPTVNAIDSCEGPLPLNCTAVHDGGEDVSDLVLNGGEFPIGVTNFWCQAVNSCDGEDSHQWSVTVQDANTLDITVQLSPTFTANAIQRCVQMVLYSDCVNPTTLNLPLQFNAPGNPQGVGSVSLSVPQNDYTCASAIDPLHTLKSSAPAECKPDGHWSVSFTGNPITGGNWLIGGNLNRSGIVDILDFGVLVSKYLTIVDPNTTCAQVANPNYRHADVNGDGIVDLVELSFIMINFADVETDICCESTGATTEQPRYSISVAELYNTGQAALTVADLNHDGVVNTQDVMALNSGVLPPPPHPKHNFGYVVQGPADD